MKKVLHFGCLVLLLSLLVSACGKDPKMGEEGGNEDMGNLALTLGASGDFEVITKAGENVNVNDFYVRIYGESLRGAAYDSIWKKYSDMPSVVAIPAGSYTIEAANGDMVSGFETPYYFGKKQFSVGIQEMTDLQVTCQLACVKVSVEFTPVFTNNVSDGICIVHQSEGVAIDFPVAKNLVPGYIAVPQDGRLAVTVRGKYIEDGTTFDKTYFINSVEARQWHKIKLSVNTSASINNSGNMLHIDHSVIEKDTEIQVPGAGDLIDNNGDTGNWEDDKPVDPQDPVVPDENAPTVKGVGFDIDKQLSISAKEQAPVVDVAIDAPKKINKLIVEIISPALDKEQLEMVGLAQKFDIANVEESMKGSLQELGLIKQGEVIKGKTQHIFSVGSFMPLLAMLPNGKGNVHKFHLTVEDMNGSVVEKDLVVNITE